MPRRYVVNALRGEQTRREGPFGVTTAHQVADTLRRQGWRATLQLVSTHARREEATAR
jgi:hypothetical protein